MRRPSIRALAPLATLLFVAVAFLTSASGLRAQADDPRFIERQCKLLNDFAEEAYEKGFYRQAKLIWLQTLKLYDPDDEEAHEGLGEVRVGSSWAPKPDFEYPTEDTGDSRDGQRLFKGYEDLKEDLAKNHEREAKKWERAGNPLKAKEHYRMVLRWTPGDEDAQEALELEVIDDGVSGTGIEQTLYQRSKLIESTVADEGRKTYEVKPFGEPNPVLQRAQVEAISFASDHFVLYGDPDQEEVLREALQWAERARAVAQVAFPWEADIRGQMAYFFSKDTYEQILRAHADRIPPKDLEFMLENSSTFGIDGLAFGATPGPQTMFDAVVRNVTRRHAGFRTPGLNEGIGHTFVGMVFNNNRLFSVDRKRLEGTTASEEDLEYVSPNFDVWKDLALEMAWKLSGSVPALDLPFVRTAEFTNEARIKSWSFCDYMMRRDPEMLRTLDRLGAEMLAKNVRAPLELSEQFEKETGVSIQQLDKEWEDFWTEASPVLAAIRNNTPPLAAVSKGVERWLAALNEQRKANGAAPVTWSANLSTRCKQHAEYLLENDDERGPAAEHTQKGELGGTHLGGMFAQMAIVETGVSVRRADDVIESWMKIPGYRDALVHGYLRTVGIYSDKDVLVMNVVAGLGTPKSVRDRQPMVWPRIQERGVPREVEVERIGPELVEALEKAGKKNVRTVGYPLTLHFGTSLPSERNSIRCSVQSRGEPIEGVLMLDGGKIRRSSAPGMAAFVPFEPLPSGQIDVVWNWRAGTSTQTARAGFLTK